MGGAAFEILAGRIFDVDLRGMRAIDAMEGFCFDVLPWDMLILQSAETRSR